MTVLCQTNTRKIKQIFIALKENSNYTFHVYTFFFIEDEQEAGGSTPTQESTSAPPGPPGFLPGMPPGIFPPGMVPPIPPPVFQGGRLPPPMPPGILPPGIAGLQFNLQRPLQLQQLRPGQMPSEQQVPPDQMQHHHNRQQQNNQHQQQQQQQHQQQQQQQHQQQQQQLGALRGLVNDNPNFNVDIRAAFNQPHLMQQRFPMSDRPAGAFPNQRPPLNERVRPNFEPRGLNMGGARFRQAFSGAPNDFERGRELLEMSQPPRQPLGILENQNNVLMARAPLRSPRPQLQAQAFLAMQGIPALAAGVAARHQNPVVRPPWQDPKNMNDTINPATALLLGLVNKQKESIAEVHQPPPHQVATHSFKRDELPVQEENRVEEGEHRRDRSSSREDRDKRSRDRGERRERSRDRRDRDRDRDDRRERSREHGDYRDKGDRYGDRGRRNRDSDRNRDYHRDDESRENREERDRRDERDRRGGDRDDRESRRSDRDRFGRDRYGRDRDEERSSEKSRPRSRSRDKSRSTRAAGQQSENENTEVNRRQETAEKQHTSNEWSKDNQQPVVEPPTSKGQESAGRLC